MITVIAILLSLLSVSAGFFILLTVNTILCEVLDILEGQWGNQSNNNGGKDNVDSR